MKGIENMTHRWETNNLAYLWKSMIGIGVALILSTASCMKLNISPYDNSQGQLLGWIGLLFPNTPYLAVAVGANGTILTSGDGIHWSAAGSPPPSTVSLNAVVYTGSRFVAVGSGTTGEAIYTSTDGTSWSAATIASSCRPALGTGGILNDATQGPGRIVAVGFGVTGAGVPAPCSQVSTDGGMTWSKGTGTGTVAYNKITFNGSIFMTIDTGVQTYTSSDGASWTATIKVPLELVAGKAGVSASMTSISNRIIAAGNGNAIASAASSNSTIDNGATTWPANSTPVFKGSATNFPRALAYNGSRILAVGDACEVDYTSDVTNLTWTNTTVYVTGSACGVAWKGLVWDGSKFIAVGSAGKIAYSPTGTATDWTITTPASAQLNGIAVRPGN